MTYYTQSQLAADQDMMLRVSACASLEGVENPQGWAAVNNWRLSAQPNWDAAYASALAAGIEYPGRDGSVISDGQILAAVHSIRAAEAAGVTS